MADEIKQTVTIDANFAKLFSELQKTKGEFSSAFSSIQSAAGQLGSALGVSLSAAAVVNFVKTSVSEIGKLQDLADRSDFGADNLLKLKPILENTGSSVEDFVSGVNAMQKSLVDGSAETIAAFKKVGISADEILKLAEDPEELIDRVAKGLANLATQTERVAVARELASKSGARIAPALLNLAQNGGLAGLRSQQGVISKQDIAAIDEAGDTINTAFIKAEAVAAKAFVDIKNGFVDVFEYIKAHPFRFAFNLDGGALTIAGTARKLRENVQAAQTGAELGGAAKLLDSGGAGLKETNAQRDFKKSLDEQIQSLHGQVLALSESKEAAIANAAEIIKTKAAQIGLGESSQELADRLAKFRAESLGLAQGQLADSLGKQNQAIEVQIARMTEGAPAAEQLALKYALLDAKLQDIGPAAQKAAEEQRRLNDEQARAVVPQILKELDDAKDAAKKKGVLLGVTFNADESIRQAVETALDKLASEKDPRARALAFEAALKLRPEIDATRLKSITTDLKIGNGLDTEFSKVLNETFTNTFDLAAAKVQRLEDALQKAKAQGLDPTGEAIRQMARDLDQAKLDQAGADLTRDLKTASNEAQVFGRSFDLGGARISAIENQLRSLIGGGLDPANEKVRELVDQLQNARVDAVFIDLKKGLEDVRNEAAVLGGAIDLPTETVDRLTESIKRLIAQGLDPLDPRIQQLKTQLEDAKVAQQFADAFQNIGQAIGDALTQIQNGDFKGALKNLQNQISRAITDAFITKPLQEQLKNLGNQIFGGIFGKPSLPGVPLPGGPEAAANAQFQVATTQFSAAVAQFSAAVAAQNAAAPAAIAGTTNPANLGSSLGAGGSNPFSFSGGGMFAGGLLANYLGKGGGAQVGFGSAPAGVEGPLMANGGFFSSAFGGLSNWFTSLFHDGGPIGKLHGGGGAINAAMVDLNSVHGDAAQKIIKQIAGLKPNERPIIAEDGEFMLRKEAVRKIGLANAEKLNRLHVGGSIARLTFPRFHDGGSMDLDRITAPSTSYMNQTGTIPDTALTSRSGGSERATSTKVELHVHGVSDADSFRRNEGTIGRALSRAVKNGMKYD